MKRRMKKLTSLLLAFSMIFSVFTIPVYASPADNTKTEQTEGSEETTAADDNQVNTAEEAQPEAAQPEEVQPEAAQPEEAQPEEVQTNTSGQQTFSLRGGSTSFRLNPDSLDVSSVSAYSVTVDDDVEIDSADPMVASVEEELGEIQVLAENEEGETEATPLTEEQIQQVLYVYQQYLDQWKANANVLGVQLPFFLSYNDKGEDGLGILGEMLVLAGKSVDDVRNGKYSFDDLMGMVQNFLYADKFGIEFYGNTIASKRDEALKKVENSGAKTFVQKLLVLNDWLAHEANFDMAYIMNMGRENPVMVAENPQKHKYYDKIYNEIYKIYEDQIRQQFHDQILNGIKKSIYDSAMEEIQNNHDAIYDQIYQTLLDQGMEDNSETKAIAEEQTQAQMEQMAQDAVTDAEENGVDTEYGHMTLEELTQAQMDQPLDDLGGKTPNEAIPVYAQQAAEGLTNGILGAWEGNHIGILAEGKGVCAGYSKAFAYLVQYMCPEKYGKNGASTDMSKSDNWKTADELYYDADGKISIDNDYVVDMIRITFDADVSMFGEDSNFGETHFWNAVKVDGQWYYVDPCYADIYVECMSRDRVEIDGTMNHMYFMFSHNSASQMYDGYMKEIATLYASASNDTSYEESWFARIASNSYFSNGKVYYMYDSTDMLAMMREYKDLQGSNGNFDSSSFESLTEAEDPTYSLVYHTISDTDIKENGADTDFTALIEFNHKEDEDSDESVALVYNPESGEMEENELITTLFEQYKTERDIYPSIKMTTGLYGGKLYFNLSNCILSYDISTGKVEKVKEYNTVYGERDNTNAFGGMAFTVTDDTDNLSVTNPPIAALTIKDDGKMYVSVATNYGFISGKSQVDYVEGEFGYEYEESNYNPDYNTFMKGNSSELQAAGYSEETNDNDEFMWSAVFVETINMASSCSHTYESVTIAPTCGRDGYTENRCTKCGAPEEDSRVVDEDSALDAHHYVHFDEEYYTKDDNGNFNTGECYVCTVCGFAIEEPDEPRADAEEEEIEEYEKQKAIWDNAVETAGHTYEPTDASWSEDSSSVTFSKLECLSVCPDRKAYLDCLLDDDTISVECSETTAEAKVTSYEGNCETGATIIYTAEGVTEEGYKYVAANTVEQELGQHTYEGEFHWTDNTDENAEVPYTVTADLTCVNPNCGDTREGVAAEVTYDKENSTAPTCEEDGKDVYVAVATVTNEEGTVVGSASETREDVIPATGHNWDEGVITWTEITDEDGKGTGEYNATATVKCLNDGCETVCEKTEKVEKDAEESIEATCDKGGKSVFNAVITVETKDGKEVVVKDSKEVEVAALGHDWTGGVITWKEIADEEGYGTGEYTATATLACKNGCGLVYEKEADVVKDEAACSEPDCENDGKIVFRASAEIETVDGNVTVNGTKEIILPALGHSFGEWVVVREATDSEDGEEQRTCSVCGKVESRAIPAFTPGWVLESGKWYYYNEDGTLATGWLLYNGKWYYLNKDGVMQTGWIQLGGTWYYLDSSGAMQTGWLQYGSNWYFLNSYGAMQTGWLQYGGNWFYLNSYGAMQTGWLHYGSNWFYLKSSGIMHTGWLHYGNTWYYLESSGIMHTGWLKLGNTWYYMNADGAMVTGTQVIGGVVYRFDSNGVWIG